MPDSPERFLIGDLEVPADVLAEVVNDIEAEGQAYESALRKELREDRTDLADYYRERPKRKRKRKRKPKKWELSAMSLNEIPTRLDAAVDDLRQRIALAAVTPWLKGAPEPIASVVVPVMEDIAEFGAHEVRRELIRQGAQLDEHEPVGDVIDFQPIAIMLLAELRNELFAAKHHRAAVLGRKRMSEDKRRAALLAEFERRLPGIAARYARRAVNEAFALGRAHEILMLRADQPRDVVALARPEVVTLARRRRRVRIDHVIHTAVLDANTCEECAKVDGEVMEYGSERQQELEPPYYKCLGGDNCRCVHFAVLGDGTMIEIADGKVVEQYEPDDDDE